MTSDFPQAISRLVFSILFVFSILVPATEAQVAESRDSHKSAMVEADTNFLDVDVPQQHYKPVPSHYTPHRKKPGNCIQFPCVLPNVQISLGPKPVAETPIIANPSNPLQLMAGANDENCGSSREGGVYNSDDGGATWSLACMNLSQGVLGGGDPGVAYDLLGNAYYTGIVYYQNLNQVFIQKSGDNGKNWSTATLAVPATLGYLADKDWLKADANPQSPYANRLYISVTQFEFLTNNTQTTVSHSSDGGDSWTTVAVDAEQLGGSAAPEEFTDMEIGPDGTVYLVWMRCSKPELATGCAGHNINYVLSKSTDGGDSWTEPQVIFSVTLAPNNNKCCFWGALPGTTVEVVDVPGIAMDKSNGTHRGTLYISYYDWTGSSMKLFVARSTDQGTTWTKTAVAPPSETHDQFFPWLSVSPAGIVGVSWLDRRNDPNNVNYEAFAAFSRDGGASFGTNIKLSEQPSNPANDGFGGRFIGDYTGNTWVGNKVFYATYTDTTTGIDQDFLVGIRLK